MDFQNQNSNELFEDIHLQNLPVDQFCEDSSDQENFLQLNQQPQSTNQLQNPQKPYQVPKDQQVETNLDQGLSRKPEFKNIFSGVIPSKSQKKNTNFVKFLVKVFLKWYKTFLKEENIEYMKFMKVVEKKIKEKNSKYITLYQLAMLFGEEDHNHEFHAINRLLMSEILGSPQIIDQQIKESNYIRKTEHKKQNLIACKIFKHRCISLHLVIRIQTK